MLVLLHLAGQSPSDLDRPHLRAEGTAEGAFDEARDLALKGSEHAHRCALPAPVQGLPIGCRRAIPCYASRAGESSSRRPERHARTASGHSATTAAATAPRATAAGWTNCVACSAFIAVEVAEASVAAQIVIRTISRASERLPTR